MTEWPIDRLADLPFVELFHASNLVDLFGDVDGRGGAASLRPELDAHLHHVNWLNLYTDNNAIIAS